MTKGKCDDSNILSCKMHESPRKKRVSQRSEVRKFVSSSATSQLKNRLVDNTRAPKRVLVPLSIHIAQVYMLFRSASLPAIQRSMWVRDLKAGRGLRVSASSQLLCFGKACFALRLVGLSWDTDCALRF